MTLLSIILCLLVDYWQSAWMKCKQHQWLICYANFIQRHFKVAAVIGSWPGIIVILLPLIVVIGLIQLAFYHWCLSLAGWIFNTIVLLYCLDTRNVQTMIRQRWLKQHTTDGAMESHGAVEAGAALTRFNHDVFAVIFWFCIFGAVGALVYRAIVVWRENAIMSDSALNSYFSLLTILTEIIDWLPVRLLALSLALMGDFVPTFRAWCHSIAAGPANNDALLQACGKAALHKRNDAGDEKEWVELGVRAVIMWVVVLALMTIAALVN